MTDARLIRIESALAHLEAALDELGGVVRAQGDRIDRLERLVAAVAGRQGEIEAEARADPAPDARPPHW